jgi:hypothetical protein
LDTAETKPLQPGDTLWLRGGTYESTTGGYNFVFNGSATAPIVVRNYNNERVTLDGTAREFSLSVNGSYIWVWGLEFEDLYPDGRTVSESGSGHQDDIQLGYGPSIYGPNNKFINCIVHNTAQGFSGYAAAPNLEVYGSLSYYNGYIAPDRNHGHGVYMENTTGTKLIADNIVGDNADEGIQVYGNSAPLIGITLQGNTTYNTWSWPTPNYQANIIMGGGGVVYGNSILQNMSFFTLSQQYGSIDIGQYTGSYDIDAEQNVFVGGLDTVAVEGINSPFTFVGNTMVNLPTGYNSTVQEQVVFGQYSGQSTSGYTWDNNAYYGTNLFYGGVYNGSSLANGAAEPFSVWSTSAFDNDSTFTPTLPTGKWIYVRPNKYETKRANITVYNWDAYDTNGNVVLGKSPSVQVDLSSILAVGDQFVIQDAQNFFGPAVVSGTYAGGTVTIPMEGLAKEVPIGFATPAHTAPGFGTFIVMVPGAGNASSGSTSPGQPTSQPLVITTSTLAAGQAGTAYSVSLTATGGTAPYVWSATSLPSGLTLSSAGVISGTPTASGTFNFAVTVNDSAASKATASAVLGLTVAAASGNTSSPPAVCPCTIWNSSAVPATIDVGAGAGVELGVKFRSDISGTITGLRFYKSAANTGPHIGNLWSSTGALLATATFTNETASGWQPVTFSSPVAITANTVYVASYYASASHYSVDLNAFTSAGVDNPPLHALQNGVSGGNGVYMYGGTSAFPTNTYYGVNYWVDVVFTPQPTCPCTIWSSNTVPSSVDNGPDSPVEVGVQFTSNINGTITGIRFYKSSANTGTHVGNLWSSTGALLASAAFTNETASGWQQVLFSSPVAITANTTYVASYHTTVGHYSADQEFFAAASVNNPPLQAPANGDNGVYVYGANSSFPNNTYQATNYWVDVIFSTTAVTAPASVPLIAVAVTPANSTINTGSNQQFTATGIYQDTTTQDISSQAIWNSSNPTVATISAAGLATGQSAGSSNITASFNGVTSLSAGLTVNTAPASVSLPSGLLLRWMFNATSIQGNTVTDSSSNDQTGTIYGNPVLVAGEFGQALQFNGTNSYVSNFAGAPFTGSITLAAWINTANKSRPEAIISRYDAAGSGTGYIFRTDGAGHLEVVFGGTNGGSVNSPAVDTAVINDGQWHHALAVITVGQSVQFYVDGKPTADVPQSFWAADASAFFYVGLNSFTDFGNFFTGGIEDVQAYNRALSPSEVNAVYSSASLPGS